MASTHKKSYTRTPFNSTDKERYVIMKMVFIRCLFCKNTCNHHLRRTFMATDPNQGQPDNPNSGYGTPANPYGAPENPYGAPQNPYSTPPPPENPYATPAYGGPYYQEAPGYIPPPSAPRPLSEALRELPEQYIRVVTRPSPL